MTHASHTHSHAFIIHVFAYRIKFLIICKKTSFLRIVFRKHKFLNSKRVTTWWGNDVKKMAVDDFPIFFILILLQLPPQSIQSDLSLLQVT